jgi:hypothetical protein
MDYGKILFKKLIDNEWTCGETYESTEWYDTTKPKPTQAELDSLWED